jgi:hypothetical protein
MLFDYETEEELRAAAAEDPSIVVSNYLRYCVTNSAVSLVANVARNCISMKAKIGRHAYTI